MEYLFNKLKQADGDSGSAWPRRSKPLVKSNTQRLRKHWLQPTGHLQPEEGAVCYVFSNVKVSAEAQQAGSMFFILKWHH